MGRGTDRFRHVPTGYRRYGEDTGGAACIRKWVKDSKETGRGA